MSYLTETDIEYQALNYLDSRQPFDSWVKSKGFSQEDAVSIKARVRELKARPPKNPHSLIYSVTPIAEDGVISLKEMLNGERINTSVQAMMDTRDKAVRAALIALGWTPPKENKDES